MPSPFQSIDLPAILEAQYEAGGGRDRVLLELATNAEGNLRGLLSQMETARNTLQAEILKVTRFLEGVDGHLGINSLGVLQGTGTMVDAKAGSASASVTALQAYVRATAADEVGR